MKNIRYFLIFGVLVYTSVAATAQLTPIYIGTLRYSSPEKAESVKKEFSDMLSKVDYVLPGGAFASPHHIPEDKGVIVNQESVSFNISKNRKYTFLCVKDQEIGIYRGKFYYIALPNINIFWKVKDLEFAKRFVDDLVYFQNMRDFVRVKDVRGFDSIAAQYRAIKVKPQIPEEARKFIVQATAQTELKNYKRAIELYEMALEVDPTNPIVYNNEALLLAIVGRYDAAIRSMKKYLTLIPDAADARAAQDKIYEWEENAAK
jgi:tetratricopeptide (TPR) repeat protein